MSSFSKELQEARKTHKIEFNPAIRSALAEETIPLPFFYTLGEMRFATTREIPSDILVEMNGRASLIMNNPYMPEYEKREKIKAIFNRCYEMAERRERIESCRDMPPLFSERNGFKNLEDCIMKTSSHLVSTHYPPGGILDQIKEQPLTPDESIELKLPKKHKTHITL